MARPPTPRGKLLFCLAFKGFPSTMDRPCPTTCGPPWLEELPRKRLPPNTNRNKQHSHGSFGDPRCEEHDQSRNGGVDGEAGVVIGLDQHRMKYALDLELLTAMAASFFSSSSMMLLVSFCFYFRSTTPACSIHFHDNDNDRNDKWKKRLLTRCFFHRWGCTQKSIVTMDSYTLLQMNRSLNISTIGYPHLFSLSLSLERSIQKEFCFVDLFYNTSLMAEYRCGWTPTKRLVHSFR